MKATLGVALGALLGLGSVSLVAQAADEARPPHPAYQKKLDMERDFKRIDSTKDDKIDMAEWVAHSNPLHPDFDAKHALPGTPRAIEREKLRYMFQEMDTNKDKVVDMAEWVNHSNPLHPDYEAKHPVPGTPKQN